MSLPRRPEPNPAGFEILDGSRRWSCCDVTRPHAWEPLPGDVLAGILVRIDHTSDLYVVQGAEHGHLWKVPLRAADIAQRKAWIRQGDRVRIACRSPFQITRSAPS